MEEIFARTINAVCAETGVSREDILSGKHDESTVDARYLLVLCGHCRKELGV